MFETFEIDPEQMDAFRRLSGDDNPLHFDAAFARARGFAGPVVYGGLIVAQVSRLLGNRLPGPGCVWQSLTLKFRRPLYVGQPARLEAELRHAAAQLGVVVLALKVTSEGAVLAEGEAMAMRAAVAAGEGVPERAPEDAREDARAGAAGA